MKVTAKYLEKNLLVDKVIKSKGVFKFREFYYYTHGRTPEKFADKIQVQLQGLNMAFEVVDTSDNWNAWPRDSYFEVQVKINSN